MLTLTLRTLRSRWTTFTGGFVAVCLGVCLLTVTGLVLAASLDAPRPTPERFAAAPVVVQGRDTVRVPTPAGDRTQRLAWPQPVPAAAVARLRKLGTVVEDRSFPLRADGGPGDLVGHPWSTAVFAPYVLDAGRAPRAADEAAVTGHWARPGERVRTDRGTFLVTGTLARQEAAAGSARDSDRPSPEGSSRPVRRSAARGAEHAVFLTDSRAAHLSPVSTQLAVDAAPAAVRAAVRGTGARVLTGAERRLADADPGRDREELTGLDALFGTAGGVTAFVSVFVVASTFSFAVAQRRREFGLLRTVGATPGQLRRALTAEALVVGVLASAAGCVLGRYAAPLLVDAVVDAGLAPARFSLGPHNWPFHVAFWTGLLVALSGVQAASWRAGRTPPVQALREASVDGTAMTPGRLLCGWALLLTAAVTLVLALHGDPGGLLHRKSYVSRPMLLIGAAALLAPAVVRPLVRLLVRLPGVTGLLVREEAAASVRRTAAVAAPVLVTVALTGSLLGATATLAAARAAEDESRTKAAFVIAPANGAGFDAATLRRLRAVPGAEVSAGASGAVWVLEDGVALIRSDARAVDPAALAATARLPLVSGSTDALDDGSIVVNEEWQQHTVGRSVRVRLGDGTPRTLRIAAVMATGTGDNGVYVTPRNAPGAVVDRVDVAVAPGADPSAVATGLREAVAAAGGRVLTASQWLRATSPETDRTTRLGLLLVLGIALLCTGLSVANTTVMAASDRHPALAALRLAGATRGQVLRLVAAEALTVTAVGALLGLLVAGLDLLGLLGALRLLSAPVVLRLPWAALGTVLAGCALLTVTASVASAALALRPRRR